MNKDIQVNTFPQMGVKVTTYSLDMGALLAPVRRYGDKMYLVSFSEIKKREEAKKGIV